MDTAWRRRADRFWARELGVDVEAFHGRGFRVFEREDEAGELRATFVGTAAVTVVSVPRDGRGLFENPGVDFDTMRAAPRAAVTMCAGYASLDVRGPAYLGYWPASSSPPPRRPVEALVAERDRAALAALRDLAPLEWDEAGFGAESILFGVRDGGALVAVAGYERWSDVAHLQVFSHPAYRRRGMSTDTLAAAVGHALAAGLLPQYRCRDGNVASRALAARFGFEEYGWMATIRLRGA
jgi:RimJ/RimL family protein N-acetyltransferase